MLPVGSRLVSQLLKSFIREHGRVEGGLVMVDGFLNHRVDVRLVGEVSAWLAPRLGAVDGILTSEASGIAPAFAVASTLEIPMVFAKKRPGRPDASLVSRPVRSPSKGDTPWLSIRPEMFDGITRMALVDDFLSAGRTAQALVEMVRGLGIEISTAGFCIEKRYEGGRERLEAIAVEVISAAVIEEVVDGRPIVA
jgi:xanthine phosphoribosyltransferase